MTINFSNIVSGISAFGGFTFPYPRSINGRVRPHKGIDLAVVNGSGVYSPPLKATVVQVG